MFYSQTKTAYKLQKHHVSSGPMNTQIILTTDKARQFVGDFNKLFDELSEWGDEDDRTQQGLMAWKEYFIGQYQEIFGEVSRLEHGLENLCLTEKNNQPTTTKPDRETKLQTVKEKLLSNRTAERFTDYGDGASIIYDPNLTLVEKIKRCQKAIDDPTRKKIHFASLQGQLLQTGFLKGKKVYEQTLKDANIKRQWAHFLRELYKLASRYNKILFCTVSLKFLRLNLKIIKEICDSDPGEWQ